MITSKTNKKIRVGIRAAVQKSNLDRGGENMKKKEQKKVLIQKGMTVGMIFSSFTGWQKDVRKKIPQ